MYVLGEICSTWYCNASTFPEWGSTAVTSLGKVHVNVVGLSMCTQCYLPCIYPLVKKVCIRKRIGNPVHCSVKHLQNCKSCRTLFIILLFGARNHCTAYPGKVTSSDITYDKNITYDLQSIQYAGMLHTHTVIPRRVTRSRYIKRSDVPFRCSARLQTT